MRPDGHRTRRAESVQFWLAFVGVVSLGLLVLEARSDARQERPTFHAGVDLVRLDVSVLDRDRRPVRGLAASDFLVREDGAAQTVEAFSEVELPDSEPMGTAWAKRVASDVEDNGGGAGRLVTIFMDDALVPMRADLIEPARRVARETIARLGPADAASVVFSWDNRKAQGFTTDRAKLLAAVENFNGGPSGGGGDQTPFYLASVTTLLDLADALIALPDRRKALVFVSRGLPFAPLPVVAAQGDGNGAQPMVRVHELVRKMLDRARLANISIYAFDPIGLEYDSPRLAPMRSGRRVMNDYLMTLAEQTGGRVRFSNDPIPAIDQMFAENKSYYLLGYRQAIPSKAGDFRRLDIKVNRPGVEVRARNLTYREPTVEERAAKFRQPPPAADLKSLANVMPDASMPLRLNLLPFAKTGGAGASVLVLLSGQEPAATVRGREMLSVLTRAFTVDGAPRGETAAAIVIDMAPAAAPGRLARFDAVQWLDIAKPGHYEIRVGLENKTRGMVGSVFAALEVPDFTARLALSGVVVSSDQSPAPVQAELLGRVVPLIPTADRVFPRTTRLTTLVRVYQGGDRALVPVTVKAALHDRRDAVVADRTDAVVAGRFQNRSADVRFEWPLDHLAPGPYAMRITATDRDKVIERDVVFTVR